MLRYIAAITGCLFFLACNNSGKTRSENTDTINKKDNVVKEMGCPGDPDTSLAKMNLRDHNSVQAIIPDDSKPNDLGEYYFYSKGHNETLTLVQHPGDGNFSISIFKIEWSNKAEKGYTYLDDSSFVSGKGIKIGMSKEDITGKLGNCYTAKDSTADTIELYYRIEAPKDTKNGLLARHNMPIYYASYRFGKNKLEKFEFGFEYP